MSSLRYIKKETMGTDVESVSITDIFSSDYDIYYLNIPTLHMANQVNLRMRFINSSGSIITSSEYDTGQQLLYSHASFGENKQVNQTYIELGYYDVDALEYGMGVSMYIFNPYSSSSYTFVLSQSSFFEQIGNGQDSRKSIGVFTETSSVTGVNFHCSTDPVLEDFEVVCYGLRVDS